MQAVIAHWLPSMALNRGLWTTLSSRLITAAELPIVSRLPISELEDPVFLLGCGRSGTTILGECVARHPDIAYLHEPRAIWARCFPETDIWSRWSQLRGGKICFTASNAEPTKAATVRRLFKYQLLKQRKQKLFEKFPINNFRAAFLAAVFPRAKFVHISRDPREVARSIQKRADNPWNGWYGHNDIKWKLLRELAAERLGIEDADQRFSNNYERGLLEWRLSVESFDEFKNQADPSVIHEITYNTLMEDPMRVINDLLEFVGLSPCDKISDFVTKRLERRTPKIDTAGYTDFEIGICGRFLEHREAQLSASG